MHCDRFEAMLTEPDAMGTVSKAEERGFDELRDSSETQLSTKPDPNCHVINL